LERFRSLEKTYGIRETHGFQKTIHFKLSITEYFDSIIIVLNSFKQLHRFPEKHFKNRFAAKLNLCHKKVVIPTCGHPKSDNDNK